MVAHVKAASPSPNLTLIMHARRGLDVEGWTKKDSITAYWGMAAYWGVARPQSRKGAMVEHVKAAGVIPKADSNPNPGAAAAPADPGRPQHSPVAHSYHTDSAEAVSLLCLAQAPEGGLSSWASSVTVHNEMIKRGRADLVKARPAQYACHPTLP